MRHLYIIGNGFDKHHGILSGYFDYRDWLRDNRPDLLKTIDEIYGLPNDDWWKSFEESLTVVKKEFFISSNRKSDASLIQELNAIDPSVLNEFDEYGYNHHEALVDRYVGARARKLVNDIKDSFEEWINSLDINKPKSNVFQIDPNEDLLALVFNYTRTLEKIYDIDYAFVNHIHGKVNEADDDSDWYDPNEFVLGHGMSNEDILIRDLDNIGEDTSCFSYEEGDENIGHVEFYAVIDGMKKTVDEIINANGSFWDSLSTVERVVIAGMSFSDIDKGYIDKVFEEVRIDAMVDVYYYSDKDAENAHEYFDPLGKTINLIKW